MNVFVRVRPLSKKEEKADGFSCVETEAGRHVFLSEFCEERDYLREKRLKCRSFTYDSVFGPTSTQSEVYRTSTAPLVLQVASGRNACCFCYGATGAGKTHTMLGTAEHPGVMVLALQGLFEELKGKATSHVKFSYLEIYNETVRDLLTPSDKVLDIRESENSTVVPGLSFFECQSADQVLTMLHAGNQRRTTEETRSNATSSRSHAVLQVLVTSTPVGGGPNDAVVGKLSLIDLAGSERHLATESRSQRSVEGANINKSLLALSSCISALVEGQKHIPFRNSKLTKLLKDSLGGTCMTSMIANVSPASNVINESANTLHWADRAKQITAKEGPATPMTPRRPRPFSAMATPSGHGSTSQYANLHGGQTPMSTGGVSTERPPIPFQLLGSSPAPTRTLSMGTKEGNPDTTTTTNPTLLGKKKDACTRCLHLSTELDTLRAKHQADRDALTGELVAAQQTLVTQASELAVAQAQAAASASASASGQIGDQDPSVAAALQAARDGQLLEMKNLLQKAETQIRLLLERNAAFEREVDGLRQSALVVQDTEAVAVQLQLREHEAQTALAEQETRQLRAAVAAAESQLAAKQSALDAMERRLEALTQNTNTSSEMTTTGTGTGKAMGKGTWRVDLGQGDGEEGATATASAPTQTRENGGVDQDASMEAMRTPPPSIFGAQATAMCSHPVADRYGPPRGRVEIDSDTDMGSPQGEEVNGSGNCHGTSNMDAALGELKKQCSKRGEAALAALRTPQRQTPSRSAVLKGTLGAMREATATATTTTNHKTTTTTTTTTPGGRKREAPTPALSPKDKQVKRSEWVDDEDANANENENENESGSGSHGEVQVDEKQQNRTKKNSRYPVRSVFGANKL